MINIRERYARFSLELTNGATITTESSAWTVPLYAIRDTDHIQVAWSDGDVSLYPMHAVVALIVHGLANATNGEQP